MQETNGGAEMVTDDEVIEGIKLLAETEGIWAETAGGVTIGCLKKMVASGFIRRDEETVAIISGGGLKTLEAVVDQLEEPLHVEPRIASFEEANRARSGALVGAQA
jgi:threonine synthase